MRKVFSISMLLLLVLFLIIPQDTYANTFREVKQTTSQTILRASASPSAKIVTTLPANSLVTQFYTVSGGWSHIQSNQYKGFVAASALKTPSSVIKIASSKSGLVVKETASRSANTVATLTYNMIVEDFGQVAGGWSFVQYGNVTGYVNSAFIGVPKTVTKTVISSDYLRNIASTSGINKGNVSAGTVVTEHSQIAGWSYVTTGKIRGYLPTKNLKTGTQSVIPKPAAQSIASFLPYRPSNLKWVQYYIDITDDYSGVVLSDNVIESVYAQNYSYYIGQTADTAKPPVMEFSKDGFYLGIPYSDFILTSMDAPMSSAKASPSYYYAVGRTPVLIGNFYLRNTNVTLTTPAGTFKNVLHIEEKYYNDPDSTHYYFAPGYGLIKWVSTKGKLYFELRSYR